MLGLGLGRGRLLRVDGALHRVGRLGFGGRAIRRRGGRLGLPRRRSRLLHRQQHLALGDAVADADLDLLDRPRERGRDVHRGLV